ncbi:hypothetical protein [Actinomyces graevenitzii]|uniref:hypothetical protein n=1 Tax=Actinomyces graevenitzii TaxID=55565 RepID=UPI0002FF5EC1|nr:hypothetical protein [Actinomyces graevenitzii]
MLGPRADATGTVWSRRRLGVKLDGDAAVSARVGSNAGPGGCQVGAVVVDEEVSSNKIGL